MRQECLEILRNYITRALIQQSANASYNIFDGLVALMQTNWDASPTTMAELRLAKKTKDKGDLLEHFAYLYFKHVYQINKQKASEVYILKDAPDDVLEHLQLKRHDMGIDLILRFDPQLSPTNPSTSQRRRTSATYCAVQVKYRQPNAYKPQAGVSWTDLSTFYALVNRSGPYRKHIILTNANYVRHIGKKEFKDQSICIGSLRKIGRDDWISMASFVSHRANDEIPKPRPLRPLKLLKIHPVVTSKLTSPASLDHEKSSDTSTIQGVDRESSISPTQETATSLEVIPISMGKPSTLEELRRKRCEYYDGKS
jgi:hypothetical protein